MRFLADGDRQARLALAVMGAVLVFLLLAGHTQALTGDEPRYYMYAVSLLRYGRFVMDLPEWRAAYLQVTGSVADSLPTGGGGVVLLNSVYLSSVLSPVAWLFGLKGVRGVTLLVGLIGLFALYRLGRRVAPARWACVAVGLAGFSMPLLAYLHLFYMETFLFTLVAVAWARLHGALRARGGDVVTALLLLVIPFVHMRGSVVAAALYAMLLWQVARRGEIGRAVGLVLLGALAGGLLVAGNLAIYGAITGPINSARPPVPAEWFPVLSMQAFNVKAGLLAFAPLWVLGYVGLAIGALRGSAIARQGLLLAAIAAITGVSYNPGECWPARFWVLSIPMLTIGLAIWGEAARTWPLRAVSVLLIGMTLLNTMLFFRAPNDFLDNRQSTTTYQSLFAKFGHLDPGLMLPVEDSDPGNQGNARNMAIGTALFALLLVLAVGRGGRSCGLLALLMLVAALDLTRVAVVPHTDYDVARAPNHLAVTLHRPIDAGYLQFGHSWLTWWAPPDWPHFKVELTTANGGQMSSSVPANQVVALACAGGLTAASVTTDVAAPSPQSLNLAQAADDGLVIYRSRSWLRPWLLPLTDPCAPP